MSLGDKVLLKICGDNLIFDLMHAQYFDILCYFVVLILVSLCALIKNEKIYNKIKNNFLKKFLLILVSGFFVAFLVFMFLVILDSKAFNGCFTKYYQSFEAKAEHEVDEIAKKIKSSKIIIVGDSRMSLIADDLQFHKPSNVEFVAKSGMKIDWLAHDAISQVNDILEDNDYNYYVVVNMGVNDLNDNKYKGDDIASDYFKLYKEIALNYSNIKFYVLSVNPIDEKKINKTWSNNNRSNKEIKLFNKTIKKEIKDSDISNMYYCDSYNSLDFKTYDGLHYTQGTNKKIINYIVNDCVQY